MSVSGSFPQPGPTSVAASEFERYRRQIRFLPRGEEDQRRLGRSRVAILGVGALGSHLAEFMVRAGIGFVRLIDDDVVETSNLQRQTLYTEADVGCGKAGAAARHLAAINSTIGLEERRLRLDERNGPGLVGDVDLVLDATDLFASRHALNRVCYTLGRPWVHTGVTAGVGQSLFIRPGQTPCLRCFVPVEAPPEGFPNVATHGILGTVVAGLSGMGATLAIRFLLELPVPPELVFYDVWNLRLQRIVVERDPRCPVCGTGRERENG